MSNNNDILNRRDRSFEQPALNKSIAKYRTVRPSKELPPRNSSVNTGFIGLFRIVLILLLLLNIMRFIISPTQIMTFTSFLQMLRTAPTVNVSWLKSFTYWGESLTSIPLIGDGLAFLVNLVSVALFGATGIIQIILYAIYFMRYLFI